MQAYVMEAMGAFFLVLIFGFTGDALAIGLLLTALVYIGYNVSGGHYNPAVSFAFFLKKKLSGAELTGYILSQLAGAFLAAAVHFLLATSVFYLEPPVSTDLYQQVLGETLFTFIFVMTMLTAGIQKNRRRKLPGIAVIVGLAFGGIVMAGMPVSGGVFNPATSIGTAAFDLITGGNSFLHIPLYTLAPLAGGAIAALAHGFLHSGRNK